jgi:hypothetical protein
MPTADIVRLVIGEAVGSSLTPFVPLPWVDDMILERLMRRIAAKVLVERGVPSYPAIAKTLVGAYVDAGKDPLASRVLVGAARFVMRKVAVILDVKKSHDVFGEAIVFALAVDIAAESRWVKESTAKEVGGAIYVALEATGSGAIDALARSARAAFKDKEGEGSRLSRAKDKLTLELETTKTTLEATLRGEAKARGLAAR